MNEQICHEDTKAPRKILFSWSLGVFVALLIFLAGLVIGELYTEHREQAWAENLIRAARLADGEDGAARLRHAAIGSLTNILIAPDHVSIFGRDGSRQWFYAPNPSPPSLTSRETQN